MIIVITTGQICNTYNRYRYKTRNTADVLNQQLPYSHSVNQLDKTVLPYCSQNLVPLNFGYAVLTHFFHHLFNRQHFGTTGMCMARYPYLTNRITKHQYNYNIIDDWWLCLQLLKVKPGLPRLNLRVYWAPFKCASCLQINSSKTLTETQHSCYKE